ncbi:IS1182 family transposase [Pseudocnuella soli]|uniref:IS1182 family transposase n=1 Tax=Pseudocnuella soli TaxID=2502779 RepID=UPI001053AC3B|nr:IS1182 family transposase [Pseudocnuella soli]
MAYVQGTDRLQTAIFCLEDFIAPHAPVRVIDAFCEQIDYVALNFRGRFTQEACRPCYHPSLLLRLYIYGYLNGIRSSRKLAQECTRNVEVMWLCNNLLPKYHTIADFRKRHGEQIREVFRQFVSVMCRWKLVGKKTIAIDGCRFRAQNSRKNNYNEDKIRRQLTYIDHKVSEYLAEMNELDRKENKKQKDEKRLQELAKNKTWMKERKNLYLHLKKQLEQSSAAQISTTDPDSRAVVHKTGVVEVSYNTQVACDAKHSLVVHYAITNENDRKALHATAMAAKESMGMHKGDPITALADKGYFNGEQLQRCAEDNVLTYVPPTYNRSQESIPASGYHLEDFRYHPCSDTYTCPEGHTLSSNGHWYKKVYIRSEQTRSTSYFKHYKTDKCLECPARHLCTVQKKGRVIERSQYAEAIEGNSKRLKQHKEIYLKRQQIVEHPFGTIKRWWGYSYTLMKGLRKVGADMGLVYLCYNLKRVMNILTTGKMLQKLQMMST